MSCPRTHGQCPWLGLKPGLLAPETSALTMRPLRLSAAQCFNIFAKAIILELPLLRGWLLHSLVQAGASCNISPFDSIVYETILKRELIIFAGKRCNIGQVVWILLKLILLTVIPLLDQSVS